VRASTRNRREFYNDPAIKVSTHDLDEINGAEGAPLCFEHNKNDVVGTVRHSWLDEDGKRLQIWARIPLNERGRKIVEEIQCGKIKGFSVGYEADMDLPEGAPLEEKQLVEKTFHEISLVYDPFFPGCNLTVGVAASAVDHQTEGKSWVFRN
jgi:phage head maturation protease